MTTSVTRAGDEAECRRVAVHPERGPVADDTSDGSVRRKATEAR